MQLPPAPPDGCAILLHDPHHTGTTLALGPWEQHLPVFRWMDGAWTREAEDPAIPIIPLLTQASPGSALHRICQSIPPALLTQAAPYVEWQCTALALLGATTRAQELCVSRPNLFWLVLKTWNHPVDASQLCHVAHDRMGWQQKDLIALAVGGPARAAQISVVKSVVCPTRDGRALRTLERVLQDDALTTCLAGSPVVTQRMCQTILRLRECAQLPAAKDAARQGEAGLLDLAALHRDLLRMCALLHLEQPERHQAIHRPRTLAQLQRSHEALVARMHTALPAQLDSSNAVFPEPPFPDSGLCVGIRSDQALKAEGREMSHCVGSYVRECVSGRSAIYRVQGAERATLEIIRGPAGWSIAQLKGPRNARVDHQTVALVQAWAREHGIAAHVLEADGRAG